MDAVLAWFTTANGHYVSIGEIEATAVAQTVVDALTRSEELGAEQE